MHSLFMLLVCSSTLSYHVFEVTSLPKLHHCVIMRLSVSKKLRKFVGPLHQACLDLCCLDIGELLGITIYSDTNLVLTSYIVANWKRTAKQLSQQPHCTCARCDSLTKLVYSTAVFNLLRLF